MAQPLRDRSVSVRETSASEGTPELAEAALGWELAVSVAQPAGLARCPVPEPVAQGDLRVALAVGPVWALDERVPEFEAWADTGPSRLRRDTPQRRRYAVVTTIGDSTVGNGTLDIRGPGSLGDGGPAPLGGLASGQTRQVTAAIPRRHPSTTTTAAM